MALRIATPDDPVIDTLTKGYPPSAAPLPLSAIGRQGWNLLREDLPLPVLGLKTSALAANGRWMGEFVAAAGASLAPHGKTTMSPALFRRQIDDGAWAMTVATVQQMQVARHFGFERLVLANQVVGRQAVAACLDALVEDPALEVFVLADSVAGVEMLAEAARARALTRPLPLLVEAGIAGGRTGCRDLAAALEVARAIKSAAPRLALRGVEGFEGVAQGSAAEREAAVRAFVAFMAEIARACAAENLFVEAPVLLSAGGSTYYDLVVAGLGDLDLGVESQLVTRSGCYLSHDSGLYRTAAAEIRARGATPLPPGGLTAALELWAYVQSTPEPCLAIATFGKRDTGIDAGYPRPLSWYRPGGAAPQVIGPGHEVFAMNDQHAYLRLPADSPLRIGDMVAFGISHPCTTFDKWRLIYLLDDAYTVTDAIATYF